MAGGKETPRQRMIGILYLVLLGLIALNVPDSLLDAFKNISDSLSASKNNVQTGINNTYDAFEKTKLKEQPDRATPIYNKAKEASKVAAELDAYVEAIKKELIAKSGGFDDKIGDYKGRDNLDVSANLMVNNKRAYDLHKKVDATREKLISLLDPKDRAGTNLALQTIAPKGKSGYPKKDWEEAYFGDGIPMGAAMTSLVKIQADAKNAENEVVKKILGKVDQAEVNLDQFAAVAAAPTSYVLAGQPYTADLYLTAYDSRSNPEITVNGSRVSVQNGVGKYSVSTSREGVYTWTASIGYKKNDGTTAHKMVTSTYQVAKPSAVVSPDKMNVLYIGVPNPISVSAPGIAKEKLKVSISGGSLSGSGGHYTAKVSSIGTATVTVSGEAAPGKNMVLGSTLFRVKRIPDPKPVFAGKSGGSTGAANIKAQNRLFARLENFDFDAKFNVTRFTLLIAKPRQDAIIIPGSGSDLNASMRAAMNSIGPGTTVVFKDIVAVGPDGTQRGLDPIVLTAN
jgi:gliding motility-associated protein GldM